jgi:hypothetical protein
MQPILINRNKPNLKQQLNFLIRQEFLITYGPHKKLALYLIGTTLIILVVALFSSTDNLIVFKGVSLVLIALAWLVAVAFSVTLLIKWIKRTHWRNKSIDSFLFADTKAYIVFEDDKLTFITDTFKSDIKLKFYKYFGEDKTSIHFFQSGKYMRRITLITTANKGYRKPDKRHPHSLSIAEPADLVKWLLAQN